MMLNVGFAGADEGNRTRQMTEALPGCLCSRRSDRSWGLGDCCCKWSVWVMYRGIVIRWPVEYLQPR